jgi:hypothetical protein
MDDFAALDSGSGIVNHSWHRCFVGVIHSLVRRSVQPPAIDLIAAAGAIRVYRSSDSQEYFPLGWLPG